MGDEQRFAKELGFDFSLTRYPRDFEPSLSATLGIPGYDEAPLDENESAPETKNSVEAEGYVAPVIVKEFHSFFDTLWKESKGDIESVSDLSRTLEAAFDQWEEERSSEVVYRTDGLSKFLPRLVAVESGQEQAFIKHLSNERFRFKDIIEGSDRIPIVRFALDDKAQQFNRKVHPLIDVICSRAEPDVRLSALHAGWIVRLSFIKLATAELRQGRYTSLRAKWTFGISDSISKILREVAEPKERPKKARQVMLGLGGRSAAVQNVKVKITTKQLTSKVTVNESKLDLFEYVCSLAQFHFENGLLDRGQFIHKMLAEMQKMHSPGVKAEPVPICICYIFVRKLVAYAPHMSLNELHKFWLRLSENLRMLYYSSPKLGEGVLLADPAFLPFQKLLEDAICFVQQVVPKHVFESWERSLHSSSSSLASLQPTTMGMKRPLAGNAVDLMDSHQDEKRLFPVEESLREKEELREAMFPRSFRSTKSVKGSRVRVNWSAVQALHRSDQDGSGLNDDDQNTDGEGQSPSASIAAGGWRRSRPSTPSNSQGQFSVSTPGGGAVAAAPLGKDSTLLQPDGVSGATDPWYKFELINNTESLHDLLKNAKKVLRKKATRKHS